MAYKAVSKSFTRVFIWFALGTEGLGFRIVWWVRVSKVFDSLVLITTFYGVYSSVSGSLNSLLWASGLWFKRSRFWGRVTCNRLQLSRAIHQKSEISLGSMRPRSRKQGDAYYI